MYQPTNQSMGQSINQSMYQSVNQSMSQSVNQSINQRTKCVMIDLSLHLKKLTAFNAPLALKTPVKSRNFISYLLGKPQGSFLPVFCRFSHLKWICLLEMESASSFDITGVSTMNGRIRRSASSTRENRLSRFILEKISDETETGIRGFVKILTDIK
jgi:hypothetical protein